MKRSFVPFIDALPRFERADLLLKRATSRWGRAISVAGLSPYSHAAMLAYRNAKPVVLDVAENRGGSSRLLWHEIKERPGIWDYYKVNTARFPEFDREAAETRMWDFDACEYGKWELCKASLVYLPIIRLFQKLDALCIDNGATAPHRDDDGNPIPEVDEHGNPVKFIPPFCSMAYAIAAEAGGVDPVNNLRHSMTTPGHLGQSKMFDYQFTLVATKEQVEEFAGRAA